MFGKININNDFLLYSIIIFYGIIILIGILKNNKILFYTDRFLLSILAIISFSNIIPEQKYFIYSIFFCLIIIGIYIAIFYIYKNFILNFSLLSSIMEILFFVSLIVFGIKNFITIQILFMATFDIFYKIIILVSSIYFKKKFNSQ